MAIKLARRKEMKLVKVFGLVATAGLALTMGLASCKKAPAPAPETAAPMAPANPLPAGTTDQVNAPAMPSAPAAQPTK
jgi:hypothetical protein